MRTRTAGLSAIRRPREAGFTLIEMLVSLALFAIVMVVCVGALLSLVGANKKAQALESAMNNLNISLDDMVRNLRQGSTYDGTGNCSGGTPAGSKDCTKGGKEIAFTTYQGKQWIYWFATDQNGIGRIYKTVDGNVADGSAITAPEVSITSMEFYVVGTTPGDTTQPRVIITISGSVSGGAVKDSTTFHLQATAVQRVLDL